MKTADIVIVGGGMVGLALAGLLAKADCRIVVLEKNAPTFDPNRISNRVSAINAASQAMLSEIGAWQRLPTSALSPYQQMDVWEKDSFGKISFDNQDPAIKPLGLAQLGFILENQHIQHALWQQVSEQANAEIKLAQIIQLGIGENGVFLSLDSGEMLSAKLVVGADGANSWVRQQSHIPLVSRDYQHTALVCNVKTHEPHQQCARQIFASDSILAFLPLRDEQHCSIVWSLPPEKAKQLHQLDEAAFNKALTIAFDNRLGLCEVVSARDTYPLTARYARNFAQPRLALIGDAAHTIHPLAGLGVNLGFADALTLAEQLQLHLAAGNDIGEYRHLRDFERCRKVEAVKVLGAMEGLKQLFSGDHPAKKLVRGIGLCLADQLPLAKPFLLQQATELAKF